MKNLTDLTNLKASIMPSVNKNSFLEVRYRGESVKRFAFRDLIEAYKFCIDNFSDLDSCEIKQVCTIKFKEET